VRGAVGAVTASIAVFVVAVAMGAVAAGAVLHWELAATAPLRAAQNESISLSCVAGGFCPAVTPAGRTASWDGSWHDAPRIHVSGGYGADVSCVEASFCVAVADAGSKVRVVNYAVIWSGAAWQTPVKLYAVDGEAGLYSSVRGVSCTRRTFCMTIGGGDSYEFDGAAWSPHPGVLSGTDGNAVIGCASRSFCMNLHDSSPNISDGSSWRHVSAEPLSAGVACVSAESCLALTNTGTTALLSSR
jgi:hypothetical protein